jgi:hypothetical protein
VTDDDDAVLSNVAKFIPMHQRRGKPGRPQRGGQNPEAVKSMERFESGPRRYLSRKQKQEDVARKYSAEDFHVAISDDNGHDKRKTLHFHPHMLHEIEMMVHRESFPFTTADDFIRVACMELLKICYELEREEVKIPNYVARLAAINRLVAISDKNRSFQQSLKTVDAEIGALLAANKESLAAVLVYDVLKEVKQVSEPSWREEYLQYLQQKYGWLIKKTGKPVKFKPVVRRKVTADEDDEDE